jgi:hypothetical protein
MTHYQAKDPGSESLVYTGGLEVMPLRGPSAQLLKLQSDGPIAITWAPTDKRATDLEVRVRLIDVIGADGDINPPVVRWHMQLGHGMYVWNQPPLSAPFAGGAPVYADYALPARGVVLRMSTRELTIRLRQIGKRDAPFDLYPALIVSVSFLPCIGMRLPAFAQQDYSPTVGGAGLPAAPFPTEANEFRVFNDHGLPFAAGDIYFVGVLGATIGPYPLASYSAFSPIPVDAIGFITSVPAWSAYR